MNFAMKALNEDGFRSLQLPQTGGSSRVLVFRIENGKPVRHEAG